MACIPGGFSLSKHRFWTLTFVLNSGDSELKSWQSWQGSSMISLSPSKQVRLLYLNAGQDRSVPHHLQFIVCSTIILSLDVVCLLSSQLKALLNTPNWSWDCIFWCHRILYKYMFQSRTTIYFVNIFHIINSLPVPIKMYSLQERNKFIMIKHKTIKYFIVVWHHSFIWLSLTLSVVANKLSTYIFAPWSIHFLYTTWDRCSLMCVNLLLFLNF